MLLDTILKENDIFSIRKYGKYKFSKIIKNLKEYTNEKDEIIFKILACTYYI